jgi:anthranilate phosphoribosyltransferase
MIVHSLDGYYEVSLTGDTRFVSNETEDNLSPVDFGFETLRQEELSGGNSIEDAAKIFRNVLEGTATQAQQNVVVANAALGIRCMFPEKPLRECLAEAGESLKSKKALAVFKKLMGK